MFEYLPTWVEPDPEPGSDILGYINIIDPNIWNPQPNQMNRIKIRDTAHASTQHQLWRQSQEPRPSPEPRPLPAPKDSQGGVPAENGLSQGDSTPQPPVPKPRTVPVAKVLVQDGSDTGHTLGTPEKEAPQNGADPRLARTTGQSQAPLQQQQSVTQDDPGGPEARLPNGLDGEEEEDDDDYVTLSDQDSLSGSSGPRRPSEASSMSDEYFEVRERSAPLQRCHSGQMTNGPGHPPHRQLSAPHITRGTFGGPLWAQGQGREESDASRKQVQQHPADRPAQVGLPSHPRVSCGLPQEPRTAVS